MKIQPKAYKIIQKYNGKNLEIDYSIFKDKYWKSFDRYRNQSKNEEE